MHDDRPDQRGDVLVGEVARPIGEIAEAPHALRQLSGGRGRVEHLVVRLIAVDPGALLAGPLDPARVGGVVQGPPGDDGVHVEDHSGRQRLVLELAHPFKGHAVVQDHLLGAVPWAPFLPEHALGVPPGGRGPLQLVGSDRLLVKGIHQVPVPRRRVHDRIGQLELARRLGGDVVDEPQQGIGQVEGESRAVDHGEGGGAGGAGPVLADGAPPLFPCEGLGRSVMGEPFPWVVFAVFDSAQ